MEIKKIAVGPIETNCYLIISDNELAVVDPGDEAEKIIAEIETTSSRHSRPGGNLDTVVPKYILLTHSHYDHVMAIDELKDKYGFKVVVSEKDKDISAINSEIGVNVPKIKVDILIPAEGATLCIGDEEIRVIETPGHTRGSICYSVGKNLFSGDTLFRHSHGRTDLPGGSDEEMKKSLEKILKLDGQLKVFPGHGEETTIQEEQNYWSG